MTPKTEGQRKLEWLLSFQWKQTVQPPLCPACQSILKENGIVLASQCPTGVDW